MLSRYGKTFESYFSMENFAFCSNCSSFSSVGNIDDKKYVDNFLRVEKWLADTPPIPGELFKQWIKDIYQKNLLIQNQMYVGDELVNLKNIDMPMFTQVAVGDHLVSPECSMPLHYAVGSEDKILKI